MIVPPMEQAAAALIVKSPDMVNTSVLSESANTPLVFSTTLPTLATSVSVTVNKASMITSSVAPGTQAQSHVLAAYQLPVEMDVIVAAFEIVSEKMNDETSVIHRNLVIFFMGSVLWLLQTKLAIIPTCPEISFIHFSWLILLFSPSISLMFRMARLLYTD
jgi:hypothetical protein